MEPQQQQQLKQYLSIVLRWKHLIIGCLLIGLIAGLGFYVKQDKLYQATALLIYERGKINQGLEKNRKFDLTAEAEQVVATLRDQVLSRTSLEDIIKKFELYKGLREGMPLEDVIELMRTKYIAINTSKGNTFTVSFYGPDPRKVMLVTNALASKFVEENLRFREEQATETSTYVKDELAIAKKQIEAKEATMRDYKLQHYNEMPDQLQINNTRLNTLQTAYQNIQSSLQELERTKIMAQEQISLRKDLLHQAAANDQLLAPLASDANSEAEIKYRQASKELNDARSGLESLLTRYTEQHPEVKRQKKIVEQLEEKVKNAAKALPATPAGEAPQNAAGQNQPYADKQLNQLELQLKDIELSLSQLKKEREETKKQIETYQRWIADAPVREAEWAGLTRDYEQLNAHYQDLVSRNLSADSAETLERKQKGSQFKIVDPAHLPEKPFKPDLAKTLLVAIALGLGAGGGVAFCLEFTDTSFKDAHIIEDYLGMPIVCSIPLILTPMEKNKRFRKEMAWLILFVIAFAGLGGGILYLWQRGIIVI